MTGPERRGTDPAHGEWDALAVGWALSALDAEDEELFAAHLPDCPLCTATVRESLYTVADLAYALPDEVPPPSLKARLMAAVAAEPRGAADWFAQADRPDGADPADTGPVPEAGASPEDVPAGPARPFGPPRPEVVRDRPDPAGPADPRDLPAPGWDRPGGAGAPGADHWSVGSGWPADLPAPVDADGPGQWSGPAPDGTGAPAGPARPQGRPAAPAEDRTVVPFESRRRTGRGRVATGAAAAAVLALLGALGGWNLQLRSEQDELRRAVAQRDAIAAQREAAIRELTTNEPARVAALTANGQPGATRQATIVVRGDRVEVIVEGLDPTGADLRYWLWTLNCDDPAAPSDLRPIEGFQNAQREFSARDIGSDPSFATATCFAISQESGTATPKAPAKVVAIGRPG